MDRASIDKSSSTTVVQPVTSSVPTSRAKTPATLKGVPQSLLDKIRAKEAAKMETALTQSPEDESRRKMLQRLPELIRILRTHFVAQKRPAIPVQDAISGFVNSYKSNLSSVEAESHLKLMAEVLPEWISVVDVQRGRFVKIDRNVEVAVLIDRINHLLKR